MYVCICKGITEKQLVDELSRSNNEQEVLKRLGVGDSCGICVIDAINQIKKDRNFSEKLACTFKKDDLK